MLQVFKRGITCGFFKSPGKCPLAKSSDIRKVNYRNGRFNILLHPIVRPQNAVVSMSCVEIKGRVWGL
jgi:hypothetical protein